VSNSILIVGSGALATLFAHRLAISGTQVNMLVGWPDGLTALSQNGARLVDGEIESAVSVKVSNKAVDFANSTRALVLVKSWQTARAANQLADCLGQDGIALSLQNGLGNYEILADHLGEQRVALGSTTTGASLLAPGQVRAGGEGQIVVAEHARIGSIFEGLVQAGFDVGKTDKLAELLWGKLAINAAINPLTALLEIANGELLGRHEFESWMQSLAYEVAELAAAQGFELPYDDAFEMAAEVARRTASNYSSMLQDIRRGAPTEIEAICGAVVRQGEKMKVETPSNQQMLQWVLEKVQGASKDFAQIINNNVPEVAIS
jgi:2-dehydropantoate 2-reductase